MLPVTASLMPEIDKRRAGGGSDIGRRIDVAFLHVVTLQHSKRRTLYLVLVAMTAFHALNLGWRHPGVPIWH